MLSKGKRVALAVLARPRLCRRRSSELGDATDFAVCGGPRVARADSAECTRTFPWPGFGCEHAGCVARLRTSHNALQPRATKPRGQTQPVRATATLRVPPSAWPCGCLASIRAPFATWGAGHARVGLRSRLCPKSVFHRRLCRVPEADSGVVRQKAGKCGIARGRPPWRIDGTESVPGACKRRTGQRIGSVPNLKRKIGFARASAFCGRVPQPCPSPTRTT